jgi:hypothetical protein
MALITANNVAKTKVTESIIAKSRCMIGLLVVLPSAFLFAS